MLSYYYHYSRKQIANYMNIREGDGSISKPLNIYHVQEML